MLSSHKTQTHLNFTVAHFGPQHHGVLRVADDYYFLTSPVQLLYPTNHSDYLRDRYPTSIFSELSARRKIMHTREGNVRLCKGAGKEATIVKEGSLDSGR
jgi:hypothetical protein